MKVVTDSAAKTRKLGGIFAREALKTIRGNAMPHALIISLEGNLGSGKTTFAQGFARGLGIAGKVLSPTFVLLKRYGLRGHRAFFHIDCYRLARSRDLGALGFGDIVKDPRAIVLIEWGDRARRLLPKHRFTVKFSHSGGNRRRISIFSSPR